MESSLTGMMRIVMSYIAKISLDGQTRTIFGNSIFLVTRWEPNVPKLLLVYILIEWMLSSLLMELQLSKLTEKVIRTTNNFIQLSNSCVTPI